VDPEKVLQAEKQAAADRAQRGINTQGFYIFTIITDGTRSIITLKITPTYLSLLFHVSYNFTILADVARHGGLTRWR